MRRVIDEMKEAQQPGALNADMIKEAVKSALDDAYDLNSERATELEAQVSFCATVTTTNTNTITITITIIITTTITIPGSHIVCVCVCGGRSSARRRRLCATRRRPCATRRPLPPLLPHVWRSSRRR